MNRITFNDFLDRAKAINVKVRHDGDHALKLYHGNKLVATVMKAKDARLLKDNYHKLPQETRDEIHAITYWLDRKTISGKGGK